MSIFELNAYMIIHTFDGLTNFPGIPGRRIKIGVSEDWLAEKRE